MNSNVINSAAVHGRQKNTENCIPIAGNWVINPICTASYCECSSRVPTTPACAWWNRPEEDNSSGKLESTHPSRTSVKSDQGFFGVE